MPLKLKELLSKNRRRLKTGEKIYVTPNHPIDAANITVQTMSELGVQLLAKLPDITKPLRVVVSMGNGASLCALGEQVKTHVPGSKVVATEDFAYGGGYDWFARLRGLARYSELFGIDPGHPKLMAKFGTYGTNAPLGVPLPLQERAVSGSLIDEYVLFASAEVLDEFKKIAPSETNRANALALPNYDRLPQTLIAHFGIPL